MGVNEELSIKLTYSNKVISPHNPSEFLIVVDKAKFISITDKSALINFLLLYNGYLPLSGSYDKFEITRKSKKLKEYVSLETDDEFKVLSRMQVKKAVSLHIHDKSLGIMSPNPQIGSNNNKETLDTSILKENTSTISNIFEIAMDRLVKPAFNNLESSLKGEIHNVLSEYMKAMEPNEAMRESYSMSLETTKAIHPEAACDICSPNVFVPLQGVRYKCLVCNNFDICEACENTIQVNKSSVSTHNYRHPTAKIVEPNDYKVYIRDIKKAETRNVIHSNFSCDRCSPYSFTPIEGARYNCLLCPNFDLCESCYDNFQDDKEVYGSHDHLHPMKKIEFDVHGPCNLSQGEEFSYNIPLGQYSEENKRKISSLLSDCSNLDFLKNIDKFTQNSERYETLLNMVELEADDEDIKFAILQSLLTSKRDEKNTEQVEPQPELSEQPENSNEIERAVNVTLDSNKPNDLTGKVLLKTKKYGPYSRIFSILLTNSSSIDFKGGNFEFKFYDDTSEEAIIVNNTSSISPGKQKFYNLKCLSDDVERFNGKRLRITTSSDDYIMEGIYQEPESELRIFKPNANTENERSRIENSNNENKAEGGNIWADLSLKSNGMAQLMVTNNEENIIDCSNMKIEVLNFLGNTICKVMVHKKHGIPNGSTAKFNIAISSAHIKHPFEVVLSTEGFKAVCQLSLKSLSGEFKVHRFVSMNDRTDIDADHSSVTETETETETDFGGVNGSDMSSQQSMRSKNSMVLPSLPKESLTDSRISNSEYLDAEPHLENVGDKMLIDEDSDYDIISTHDDTDYNEHDDTIENDDERDDGFGSDYEVLSTVTSN